MNSNAYYQSKLGVRFYDRFSGDARSSLDGPVKGDVEFYVECAREFSGPVLELATGTGRGLWRNAIAGFDIVGTDISDDMPAVPRAKGEQESSAVQERVRLYRMKVNSQSCSAGAA
jgi:hypothetical protein